MAVGKATKLRRGLEVLVLIVAAPVLAHIAVVETTAMRLPAVALPPEQVLTRSPADGSLLRHGRAYARRRGTILEVRLEGSPEQIGQAHARLLYPQMVTIEQELHRMFEHYVPLAPARWLIVDLARLRFRHLDQLMSGRYRAEIASQAALFEPDPFAAMMATYQRFIFLHSLYDIMLSFERSPLVGCTSFVLTGRATTDGHTLLGRNFDFEGPQILDDEKAVFLVFEEGRIPYASVSWPGFVGSASGINRHGLAVVIHGARAGEPSSSGEPVAHTVRDLLGEAHNVSEAVALLTGRPPMVPHMLLIADAAGAAVVVERVPGQGLAVRRRQGVSLPLTNHFEGPMAEHPKNLEVMRTTSSVARRRRLDEILANLAAPISVKRAVEILRDKRGPGNTELPLGHRSAIDALIATHSVLMDTTARTLWVSEGPHATGRYVEFDLAELLDMSYSPTETKEPVEALPADPIVADGRFQAWVTGGSIHPGVE